MINKNKNISAELFFVKIIEQELSSRGEKLNNIEKEFLLLSGSNFINGKIPKRIIKFFEQVDREEWINRLVAILHDARQKAIKKCKVSEVVEVKKGLQLPKAWVEKYVEIYEKGMDSLVISGVLQNAFINSPFKKMEHTNIVTGRKEWSKIASNISEYLSKFFKEWHLSLLRAIRSSEEYPIRMRENVEVIDSSLELVAKGYQLFLVIGALAENSYISSGEEEFLDVFIKQMSGDLYEDLIRVLMDYQIAEEGGYASGAHEKFVLDYSKKITSDAESALFASVFVAALMGEFRNGVKSIVATFFDDNKTVEEIKRQ
jgi:hypothetical protein